MTKKRFKEHYQGKTIVSVHDTKNNNELVNILQCVDLLNRIVDENEQLKQFISKIDFAIIRKYDNSLENLLDEVYDGEYENWIKKQVSRAKKLDGDVE